MSGHIAALSDSVTRKKVVYKNRIKRGHHPNARGGFTTTPLVPRLR